MKNKRKNRKNGITRRWVFVSLLTTVVVLAVAATGVIVSTRRSFYDYARQALETRVRLLAGGVSASAGSESRASSLREAVENFAEKDRFELMLVSGRGSVIATSSGFGYSLEEPMDDYYLATGADSGQGFFVGYTSRGEHIIAVTQILSHSAGDIEAVRLVSSLTKIDARINGIIRGALLICMIIIALNVLSGMYFVRSIVRPLDKIGVTAGRIADGDFDVRIDNVYNDEIGDLCDIINDMATGLSASDRLKNEFISSVSHELRTPLTAIKGWGETLQNSGGDGEIFHKGMDIIIGETERLSLLVEDLLDFSRLQSGRSMTVNPLPVDVLPVLRETVEIFRQRAANLGIELRYNATEHPVMIMGDVNRLRQVFTNIIDNAIKYSGAHGQVEIGATVAQGRVSISVTDGGIGIPQEELSRITDRFFKASNSVTGSGIGLAVVKEIVGMHGGDLIIDSELGRGTTVTVALPLIEK